MAAARMACMLAGCGWLVPAWGGAVNCKADFRVMEEQDGAQSVQVEVPLTKPGPVELVYHFPWEDYKAGSVTAPQGFQVLFSEDDGATYQAFEPHSGVDYIKVTGTVPPGPRAVLTLPPPITAAAPVATSGSDAFEPLPMGRRVFSIWHRTATLSQPPRNLLVCTEMVAHAGVGGSQVCSGYGGPASEGYAVSIGGAVPAVSEGNVGYADAANGRIVYPARLGRDVGFVCIETPREGLPALCPASGSAAFWKDGFVEVDSTGADIGWGSADYLQQRLYAVDHSTRRVHCLDLAAPADLRPCEGYPYATHGIEVLRASVMPKTSRVILAGINQAACMETSTSPPSRCAGWPPSISTTGLVGQLIRVTNARGVALGFCHYLRASAVTCFHLRNGSAAGRGTELGAAGLQFEGVSAPGVIDMLVSSEYSHPAVAQARSYFAVGALGRRQRWVCYDGESRGMCPGYPYEPPAGWLARSMAVDHLSGGACVWALDAASSVLRSFAAREPTQPCGAEQPSVLVAPKCGEVRWHSAQLLETNPWDHKGAQLSVQDAAGRVVTRGNIAGAPVSLAAVPTSAATAALRFTLSFEEPAADLFLVSATRRKLPQLEVTWEGCPAASSARAASLIRVGGNSCDTTSLVVAEDAPTSQERAPQYGLRAQLQKARPGVGGAAPGAGARGGRRRGVRRASAGVLGGGTTAARSGCFVWSMAYEEFGSREAERCAIVVVGRIRDLLCPDMDPFLT